MKPKIGDFAIAHSGARSGQFLFGRITRIADANIEIAPYLRILVDSSGVIVSERTAADFELPWYPKEVVELFTPTKERRHLMQRLGGKLGRIARAHGAPGVG